MESICATVQCSRLHGTKSESNPGSEVGSDSSAEQPSSETYYQYNLALDVAGAQVIYQMTSATHGLTLSCRMKRWWTAGEASCNHEFVLPAEVLRAGDAVEGECWTFQGGTGHIAIRLSERAKISSLTIQHVMPFTWHQSPNAPRTMSLWGLTSEADQPALQRTSGIFSKPADFHTYKRFSLPGDVQSTGTFVLFGQLEYLWGESTPSEQVFVIEHPDDLLDGFRVVVLAVTSNWGTGADLTCISRVKVHGVPLSRDS
ncbi:hypothetical protein B0H15DRAFT_794617 [Mycena belliarum]|uniref:SUN domain-containing protein n=1 Tax=Mycena belliarum TaxID=1033014 RepID=A0AAD6TMB0_9AGAR|nr:hypothetical protein B0H15DRAFT_794617 [Mycena belliae]